MKTPKSKIKKAKQQKTTILFFFAGLAHCRHLRTVRTHLSGLVHPAIISEEESAKNGLTEEKWLEMFNEDVVGVTDKLNFYCISRKL